MKVVDERELIDGLRGLLSEVEGGTEVVIERDGKPIVRMTSVPAIRRQAGMLADAAKRMGFVYDPSIFAPMTDEELREEGWDI